MFFYYCMFITYNKIYYDQYLELHIFKMANQFERPKNRSDSLKI